MYTYDSDFFFVTNNEVMVKCAKKSYEDYPTVVNKLKESGITYDNNPLEYARMDNKFSKSKMGIGESSNLAQLAMTYYWNDMGDQELYDNFIILAVLAQVVIDGCKREYEVDALMEIARIKRMTCMNRDKDLPSFMKYTKDIQITKNGKTRDYEDIKKDKEKIDNRIDEELICPMNWLQNCLNNIKRLSTKKTENTKDFFIKMSGKSKNEQITKIRSLISEYDDFVKNFVNEDVEELIEKNEKLMLNLNKIKIGNIITINRLVETALGLEIKRSTITINSKNVKYARKILNCLYKMNKEKFLMNFTKD